MVYKGRYAPEKIILIEAFINVLFDNQSALNIGLFVLYSLTFD